MATPEGTRARRLPALLAALAVASVYVASFFLPVLDVMNATFVGWDAYWVVAQRPWENPPLKTGELLQILVQWLPNPLMWVGIVLLALGRATSAVCLGLLALAAGLSSAFDVETFRLDFGQLRAGYYCWLASMALLAGAGVALGLWQARALTDGASSDV